MSRDLAREAIRRLKLVGNPEFDPGSSSIGPVQRVMMMLGIGANPLDRPAEDRVLDAYFEHLLVYPAGKSRILTIEFRAKDPKLAAEGANTIAQLYISSLEAGQVDTARYASSWLGGNIDGFAQARRGSRSEGRGVPRQERVGRQRRRHRPAAHHPAARRAVEPALPGPDPEGRPRRPGEGDQGPDQGRPRLRDHRGRQQRDDPPDRRQPDRRPGPARAGIAHAAAAHPRIKELHAQLEDLDAQIKTRPSASCAPWRTTRRSPAPGREPAGRRRRPAGRCGEGQCQRDPAPGPGARGQGHSASARILPVPLP